MPHYKIHFFFKLYNRQLKKFDKIIDDILGQVDLEEPKCLVESVLKLQKYGINWSQKRVHDQ